MDLLDSGLFTLYYNQQQFSVVQWPQGLQTPVAKIERILSLFCFVLSVLSCLFCLVCFVYYVSSADLEQA